MMTSIILAGALLAAIPETGGIDVGRTRGGGSVPTSWFPVQTMLPNDATPDVSGGNVFVTADSDGGYLITDLDNAEEGQTITLCGANETTEEEWPSIETGGNFTLEADFRFSNGGCLSLLAVSTSSFVELTRGPMTKRWFSPQLVADSGDETALFIDYSVSKATSGDDYGLRIEQTDTDSPGASYLIHAGTSAAAQWYVDNTGYTYQAGSADIGGALSAASVAATGAGTFGTIASGAMTIDGGVTMAETTGLIRSEMRATDAAAKALVVRGGNPVQSSATPTNTSGGDLVLGGGIGRRAITITDYSASAGDTVAVAVGGAGTVAITSLVEGTNFNCVGTSNNTCATNLGAAIDAIAGVSASVSSAIIVVSPDATTGGIDLTYTSGGTVALTLAEGAPGVTRIYGDVKFFGPDPLGAGEAFSVNRYGSVIAYGQLTTSSWLNLSSRLNGTPPSARSIVAATGLASADINYANTYIQGSGGAVDITANPQIVDGANGQVLWIWGASDSASVQFDDGDGLQLAGGASFVMGLGDHLCLTFINSDWRECGRSDN